MQELAGEYTLFAPDLLGYGQSSRPEHIRGRDFYRIHIDSLRQLTQALGLGSFLLAGLSMGGAIAIGYALQYPTQVKALFPVDSWGLSPTLPWPRLTRWYIHKTELTLAQYRWVARSRRLAKWLIAYSLIGDRGKISPELVAEVRQACRDGAAGYSMLDYQRSSFTKNGPRPYYGDELRRLTMPVVLISGERDPLVPAGHVIAAQELLPQGKVYILPGCKHWTVREAPEEFCRILRENAELL